MNAMTVAIAKASKAENAKNAVTEAGADVLKQSLATVLQKATEGVEAGVGFLSAQLPDVIHQLLLFKLVWGVAVIVIFTSLFVVLLKVSKHFIEKANGDKWINVFPGLLAVVSAAVTVVVGLIGIFVTIASIKTVLMIWLAPKIYLIQYAAELLK